MTADDELLITVDSTGAQNVQSVLCEGSRLVETHDVEFSSDVDPVEEDY